MVLILSVHHQFMNFNTQFRWKTIFAQLEADACCSTRLFLHVDRKVFSKLNLHVPEKTVRRIVLNAAGAVEPILHVLREKIQEKVDHAGENTVGRPGCPPTDTHVKYCAFIVILPIGNN